MGKTSVQKGRAVPVKRVRNQVFEDFAWDERVEQIVKHTWRTSTVIELTGTTAREVRIKKLILEILKDWGIEPRLPRGAPPSYDTTTFIRRDDQRLDSAYLVALHYGQRGPGEYSEVESDLGQAADKMLEVYSRYLSDLYPQRDRGGAQPKVSFDEYVALKKGIQAKAIVMHHCRACGSSTPYSALNTVHPSCPTCVRLKLEMPRVREQSMKKIAAGKAARRAEGSVAAAA